RICSIISASGTHQLLSIGSTKEAPGHRHAWRLKFGRIDRREGAILGAHTTRVARPSASLSGRVGTVIP
ncbi:MAG: hypothetical protein O6703_04620, partial [Gammaproteobacteria bacterium]|nr:hypothetical protein [Gammaproteobacteria bacterium]